MTRADLAILTAGWLILILGIAWCCAVGPAGAQWLGSPPPQPPLPPHEAAILRCFQTGPWVDRDNRWLKACLEAAPQHPHVPPH